MTCLYIMHCTISDLKFGQKRGGEALQGREQRTQRDEEDLEDLKRDHSIYGKLLIISKSFITYWCIIVCYKYIYRVKLVKYEHIL